MYQCHYKIVTIDIIFFEKWLLKILVVKNQWGGFKMAKPSFEMAIKFIWLFWNVHGSFKTWNGFKTASNSLHLIQSKNILSHS